jgi:site-specific recombinase XerC
LIFSIICKHTIIEYLLKIIGISLRKIGKGRKIRNVPLMAKIINHLQAYLKEFIPYYIKMYLPNKAGT